ncbi:ABC transporter substrate-binding protein [Shimia sp. R10_1]|uniref:ABC transporter substrate-binding protein n=1 Tax=Shimia sp. R10_1 TaxID=2821095 RepID=UPI001ADA1C2E|nr:ABC transporter substrate-binding protein [Shimia sp. R10_1]MBO9473556.1 ABC transporter substrate-binding protein [Shimia sp. R10_1]
MVLRVFALLCALIGALSGPASAESVKLYLDADRTSNYASARAIEVGMRAAFDEVGHVIDGRAVEFVVLDHRANARRSQRHLQQFLTDPEAIAVVGGLHSPPYLRAKDYVNENGIPLVLPWSAAAPLTRSETERNSIFRLSLDDSKAAKIIVPQAVETDQCQNVSLVLWRSGWGESNEKTMVAEMQKLGFEAYTVRYFSGNLSMADAVSLARDLDMAGSDCAIYVGNSADAATIFAALNETQVALHMYSHWGITGGNFETQVPTQVRDELALTFIQPCFDFDTGDALTSERLETVARTYQEDFDAEGYLRAPAGFFHGFDLGLLLIEALRQVDPSVDIASQRAMFVAAMTQIEGPISGLLRSYSLPFSPYAPDNPDAHEALDVGDFCMARFDADDRIVTARADSF